MVMRVFLTGASSGLGEGLARHYAEEGATVGIAARRKTRLAKLAREIGKIGGTAHVFVLDVADTDACQEAADRFLADVGTPDIVIANAGIGIKDGLLKGKSQDVAALFRTNLIGVSNTVVPFLPKMVARGAGVVSAVGSVAGFGVIPGRTAYCASKMAVKAFMDGLRMDLHGTGVHAMTLCPGFVETAMTANNPDMMFVMSIDDAVQEMSDAITKRKPTHTFPWQMSLLKEVQKRAPDGLLRKFAPRPRTR